MEIKREGGGNQKGGEWKAGVRGAGTKREGIGNRNK